MDMTPVTERPCTTVAEIERQRDELARELYACVDFLRLALRVNAPDRNPNEHLRVASAMAVLKAAGKLP